MSRSPYARLSPSSPGVPWSCPPWVLPCLLPVSRVCPQGSPPVSFRQGSQGCPRGSDRPVLPGVLETSREVVLGGHLSSSPGLSSRPLPVSSRRVLSGPSGSFSRGPPGLSSAVIRRRREVLPGSFLPAWSRGSLRGPGVPPRGVLSRACPGGHSAVPEGPGVVVSSACPGGHSSLDLRYRKSDPDRVSSGVIRRRTRQGHRGLVDLSLAPGSPGVSSRSPGGPRGPVGRR